MTVSQTPDEHQYIPNSRQSGRLTAAGTQPDFDRLLERLCEAHLVDAYSTIGPRRLRKSRPRVVLLVQQPPLRHILRPSGSVGRSQVSLSLPDIHMIAACSARYRGHDHSIAGLRLPRRLWAMGSISSSASILSKLGRLTYVVCEVVLVTEGKGCTSELYLSVWTEPSR